MENTQIPQNALPKSLRELQTMMTDEWRHDYVYCQLLDRGIDPGDAAVETALITSEPLQYDFGPPELDLEEDD